MKRHLMIRAGERIRPVKIDFVLPGAALMMAALRLNVHGRKRQADFPAHILAAVQRRHIEVSGAILRPLLDDLLAARDEDAAMALLGNAYPQLDSSLLEERLAQLMFAAELIGRISAADETKP